MSLHEIMVYQYACDGCGNTEDSEIEEVPVGWISVEEEHFCERCSMGE